MTAATEEKETTVTTTNPARKPAKSRTGQRMLAAGLASTACMGLVGVIGVRAAQSSSPATEPASDQEPVSSSGYTQADLDAYAAQLADQSAQLADYRRQLKQVANQLNSEIAAYNDALATGQPAIAQGTTGDSIPTNNSGGGGQWQPSNQGQQPQSNTKSS